MLQRTAPCVLHIIKPSNVFLNLALPVVRFCTVRKKLLITSAWLDHHQNSMSNCHSKSNSWEKKTPQRVFLFLACFVHAYSGFLTIQSFEFFLCCYAARQDFTLRFYTCVMCLQSFHSCIDLITELNAEEQWFPNALAKSLPIHTFTRCPKDKTLSKS